MTYKPEVQTQLLLTSLRGQIPSLEDLKHLLLEARHGLDYTSSSSSSLPTTYTEIKTLRVLPTLQHIILNTVLPTWFAALQDASLLTLVKDFFCPSPVESTNSFQRVPRDSETHCRIVTIALPTLLSHLPTLTAKDLGPTAILDFCLSILEDISSFYPVDVVHHGLFSSLDARARSEVTDTRLTREWEDFVRSICSVPGKVANAVQGRSDIKLKEDLENGPYFSSMCEHTEKLLFQISQVPVGEIVLASQSHLLGKLLNLGLFPSIPPSVLSQPSFFASTLGTIRRRLWLTHASTTSSEAASSRYSETWADAIHTFSSTHQQTFLTSLLGTLHCDIGIDTSPRARRKTGESARVLRGLLGRLDTKREETETSGDEDIWDTTTAIVCGSGRTWDVGVARAIVCFVADPQGNDVNEHALERLFDAAVAVWTNPEYIRHSLLSQHIYTSSLLLLTLAALPKSSRVPERLALSTPFISSITTYIGHLDRSVRRCGMLIAEVVAARCGKKLEFGGWAGESKGLDWARTMRVWQNDWVAEGFDVAKDYSPTPLVSEVHDESTRLEPEPAPPASPPASASYDSDDSLTGYASAASSRTPSPTPSELDEIEKDPSLRVGRKKQVVRPVYLAQLASMLRTDKNNDEGEAERLEVALTAAEALIRRKKGFGLELEENAVEMTIALVALHDNYELPGFDEKRQGALTALVACCPRKAAMTLIEQLFTNQYSTAQRFVILTALALGARALAKLPVPPSQVPRERIAFPSKTLPPALHRRYAVEQGTVQQLAQGISRQAIAKSQEAVEDIVPEVVRQRQLRVGRLGSTRVVEVQGPSKDTVSDTETMFADVAAEHFIVPLVNHMWQHLRDAQTRGRRGGAGSALLLDAIILAQYLGTLAVLMHAARHALAYLSVLVPEALEVALALGSRPVEAGTGAEDGEKEAAVLTAALEVVLVVMDACVELDGGRVLGLERTALLLAVGEWAGSVFEVLERGSKVRGGGGEVEGRMGSAAAGVVLKVDQVTEKWRRSMVGL